MPSYFDGIVHPRQMVTVNTQDLRVGKDLAQIRLGNSYSPYMSSTAKISAGEFIADSDLLLYDKDLRSGPNGTAHITPGRTLKQLTVLNPEETSLILPDTATSSKNDDGSVTISGLAQCSSSPVNVAEALDNTRFTARVRDDRQKSSGPHTPG